jgi:formylglycine-generating enzyme required for sulfatase activity
MVKVPAGTYKLPGGKTATIEQDFWIDKYEVTIAQYQRFLKYLDDPQHSTEDQDFRHPKMPRFLTHKPEFWEIYYGQAKVNGAAHSVKIDLNCPAITVTWWDAYAYAKWLGKQTGTERDLPTEEEWEVAASGGKGFKYPWGNEFDESNANTNLDYHGGNPGAKADKDGFVYWGDVDAKGSDKSPFGVVGMAGNVAEWTGSWTKDNKFPIIKGGDFFHPPTTIDKRISDHTGDKGEEWLGFRTISRTAPPDAE